MEANREIFRQFRLRPKKTTTTTGQSDERCVVVSWLVGRDGSACYVDSHSEGEENYIDFIPKLVDYVHPTMTIKRSLLVLSCLVAFAGICVAQNPVCCFCGGAPPCQFDITNPDFIVTLPDDPRLPVDSAACSLLVQVAEQLLAIPAAVRFVSNCYAKR